MARGSCPEIRTDCPYFEEGCYIHEGLHPVKPSIEVMEHSIIASGVHISKRLRKALGS